MKKVAYIIVVAALLSPVLVFAGEHTRNSQYDFSGVQCEQEGAKDLSDANDRSRSSQRSRTSKANR